MRRIVAGTVIALALAPPAAGATPPLRFLTNQWTATDGARYVFRNPGGRGLRVLDIRTKTWLGIVPKGCAWSLGRGWVVVGCTAGDDDRNRPPTIFDLSARSSQVAPAPDPPLPTFSHPDYANPGANWIERFVTRVHPHSDVQDDFVNWHTGQVMPPSRSATEIDDPNLPGLHRPLCAPLHRLRNEQDPYFGGRTFGEYQYEPPYGLAAAGRPADALPYYVLQRCGSPRSRFVCRGCSPQLGAGVMTWYRETPDRFRVWADFLRTGRRVHWDLPRARIDSLLVTHTSRRLYVTTSPYAYRGTGTTYSARLP